LKRSLLNLANPIRLLSSISVLLFLLAGCDYYDKPTYPEKNIIEAVKQICRDEYDLDVKAKVTGKTLCIYLVLENLIDSDLRLSQDASEVVDHLTLTVSRVTLSTDADIRFYLVIARDKDVPNAELIMVRYVDDVRRLLRYNISRDDYLSRMILDLRFNPVPRSSPDSDDIFFTDINFEYFLSYQLQKRLDNLLASKTKGNFLNQDGVKYFQFDLELDELDEEALTGILEMLTGVLEKYDFRDFNGIIIVNEKTNFKERYSKTDLITYGWRTEDETYTRWFWRRFIEARRKK